MKVMQARTNQTPIKDQRQRDADIKSSFKKTKATDEPTGAGMAPTNLPSLNGYEDRLLVGHVRATARRHRRMSRRFDGGRP